MAARVSSAHTDSIAARPRRRWLALRALLTRDPQRVRAHVHKAPETRQESHALSPFFASLPRTLTRQRGALSAARPLSSAYRPLLSYSGLQPHERFPSTSPSRAFQHERLAARLLSTAPRPLLSFATPCPPHSSRSAPLLGVLNLSPPIGGGHASSSRHRDRWLSTPGEKPRGIFFRSNPKQWEAFFLFFPPRCLLAGNSRRSRTIARFARESRAGNLAASPSIPRGT